MPTPNRQFAVMDVVQGTPEWHQVRLGRLCSSKAADMLATLKSGGEAAGRRNLRVQLALERITGRSQDREFQSQAMKDGAERERDARSLYEAVTGEIVTETGFLAHIQHEAGASLDGHLGDFEGIVEIKSPIAATHWDYIKTGVIPGEYQKQILHALWITGAAWCDWLSYHPEFPESIRVKLVRVKRDDKAIAEYEQKAIAFLAEVSREYAEIDAMDHAERIARTA